MKLDKLTKILLRNRWRALIDAEMTKIRDDATAALERAARTRLETKWADKQADMAVLAKYGHALPVMGANLRVYDPERKDYSECFGIKFNAGLMIPATGGDSTYWSGYVAKLDPDHAAIWSLVEIRRTWNRRRAERIAELDAALRATTSAKKIFAQFPELERTQP